MKMSDRGSPFLRGLVPAFLACALWTSGYAQTNLADTPPDVSQGIPGNLLFALSVEYPTAVSTANSSGTYYSTTTYVGYFDPAKCYNYQFDTSPTSPYFGNLEGDLGTSTSPGTGATLNAGNYFIPAGLATNHTCSGQWSGNFLNWATMQSIDPFRWALTGGYRAIDRTNFTVLEKAWASGQGGSGETPNKTLSTGVNTVTPFNWSSITLRIWGLGNRMDFSSSAGSIDGVNGSTADTPYNPADVPVAGKLYSVKARVAACVSVALEESNCTGYPVGATTPTSLKPEGLIQQYSSTVRFGVMGYLNDSNIQRDAGVLRAQMEFVGPTYPVPGATASVNNTQNEWSPVDGTYVLNPDATDAANTLCSGVPCANLQSGVVNYLNKFGESAQSYKTYDPVSELYYAAYRYFKYQIVNSAGAVTPLGNVPQWSTLTTASSAAQQQTWVDGFPVITAWADPIQYACQKNFILGIGDVNTHASGNVPGNTTVLPQYNGTWEPAKPAGVTADSTIDSVAVTNQVGALEGTLPGTTMPNQNLGQDNVPWCCGDDATYYMAGLAYAAHTTDLRPNDPNFSQAANLYPPGNANAGSKIAIQTVETYWLDVQENQTYRYQSQFWLAAKYGGFSIPSGGLPPYYGYQPGTALTVPQWSSGTNLPVNAAHTQNGYTGPYSGTGGGDSSQPGGQGYAIPDNYFGAGNAQAMVAGLGKAFASIVGQIKEVTNPFGVPSPNLSAGGSTSFSTQYSAATWSGDLQAFNTTFDANDNPISTLLWSVEGFTASSPTSPVTADEILNQQLADFTVAGVTMHGWDVNRNVVTFNGTNGQPFRLANLTTAQLSSFATVTGDVTAQHTPLKYLNYLRGDRSNELGSAPSAQPPSGAVVPAAGYRARNPATVLGDIIDSKVTVLAAPIAPYADIYNPGYSTFTTTYANRVPTVFFGANDGMVHAFNGSSGAPPGGTELFAYIPSLLFQGPGTAPASATTPTVNGLASLGAQPFSHHMFVDATPEAFDIDMSYTGTGHPAIGTGDWHTLLIGGLGKGGRGYYALDVTNPAGLASETAAAAAVKWEFTDPRMGYSYGDPNVLKTKRYGWVVIFTSGYNNSDGHGYIFVVNPATGTLLETVTTPDNGTPVTPSGLTYASGFVASFADNTADSLYAGDLLGNMWRFDLTSLTQPIAVTQFAHVIGPDGYVQPITTRPLIELDPTTNSTRYVLFGTGQLLASTDITNTNIQSFYSIRDGTLAAFASAATLPTGVTFPITRANLVQLTNTLETTTGVTGTAAKPEGYYFDLPPAATGQGSPRVNVNPEPDFGTVTFAGNIPNGNVCYPTGTNQVYALDIANGASQITDSNNNTLAYDTVPGGMVTSNTIVQKKLGADGTPAGKIAGKAFDVICTSAGNCVSIQPKSTGSGAVQRLNWREVPTSD